ncbi:hypothetical protein cand_031610 [Cryptosporidium andersoni]|uniref:Uncharacterized protein n=1 Tax=Cryptosporidium andersoni TaxID=117008 RepID=A0A1J4MB50_9CRYT|nr:hypothetical protein cand_031610 [Cryptosporidium andersoni]
MFYKIPPPPPQKLSNVSSKSNILGEFNNINNKLSQNDLNHKEHITEIYDSTFVTVPEWLEEPSWFCDALKEENLSNYKGTDIYLYSSASKSFYPNNDCHLEQIHDDFNSMTHSYGSRSGTKITTSKRPRHFFCYSCHQFKPRSTKARFKVCKHVSCYHCLRKALHVEFWAAKKDIWEKCRAVCPFCHIVLDWTKMKPYIVLSFEAKTLPLLALCSIEDRQLEAHKVIQAFFPQGVPSHVICGYSIDMSIKPLVTQRLFGYILDIESNTKSCSEIPGIKGEEIIKDENDGIISLSTSTTVTPCSSTSRKSSLGTAIWSDEYKAIDLPLSSSTLYKQGEWLINRYQIYPDIFELWRMDFENNKNYFEYSRLQVADTCIKSYDVKITTQCSIDTRTDTTFCDEYDCYQDIGLILE